MKQTLQTQTLERKKTAITAIELNFDVVAESSRAHNLRGNVYNFISVSLITGRQV